MKMTKKFFTLLFLVVFLLIIRFNEFCYYWSNKFLPESRRFIRQKYPVNCKLIFEMNKNEIDKAKDLVKTLQNKSDLIDDKSFIFDESYCKNFKDNFKFDYSEKNFPLAISILVNENAEQVFRLLRAIYHPENIYCIHIDKKSKENFHIAIRSMVKCFDNVFLSTKFENIVYGGFSRLQADINCLKDLVSLNNLTKNVRHENLIDKKLINWKYAFNIVGTEFPLRTNSELIKIIEMYNGSNEIELVKIDSFLNRVEYEWIEDNNSNKIFKTNFKKREPPHGFKIFKGYSSYLISRDFANYAVFDKKVQDFLKWSQNTYSPDEIFWSTVHFNTKFFSSHGLKYDSTVEKFDSLIKYAGWNGEKNDCNGYYRHGICIFSVEDLPELISRPHFFANKFLIQKDPVAYQCMEEWFEERKMNEHFSLNMFFYCKFIQSRSSIANCANIKSDIDFKRIKLFSSIINTF